VTSPEEKPAKDWETFAAKYARGLAKTYETTVSTEANSRSELTRLSTETVTVASADEVSFEKSERLIRPRETQPTSRKWKVAKQERISDCMTGATGTPLDERVEVLEEKPARRTSTSRRFGGGQACSTWS